MIPDAFSTGVLFATSNKGKFEEVSSYARALGFSVSDPSSISDGAGGVPVVAEVSATYEGNAEQKARAFLRWSKLPCLADDSGIEINRLNGLPGRFTSRWGLKRVASELSPFSCSQATFVCAMAFADLSGRVISTRASLVGEVRNVPITGGESDKHLPFSDYFYPRGYNESLSLLVARGECVSHRFRALQALLRVLA